MLKIDNLSFRYNSRSDPILTGLNLELAPGEILALTGGSGSGKTTLLKILAGLEDADTGEVSLEGRVMISQGKSQVPPEKRGMSLMFQDLALFPHMTVWENARFAADSVTEQETQVLLALTDLKVLKDRYPHQLSGGQKQRLALVRALGGRPRFILLDEPFNNLDKKLIDELCVEFRGLIKARGVGALVVTHDKDQAYQLADRIGFLEGGKVVQVSIPQEFYQNPRSLKAGRFGGPLNLAVVKDGSLGHRLFQDIMGFPPQDSRAHWIALRPEHLFLSPHGCPGQPGDLNYEIRILDYRYHGREWVNRIRWPEGEIWEVYSSAPLSPGPGNLSWNPRHTIVIDG